MSERLILWRIILPQVVRRMLPESINMFISLFKATTIVSLIAVPDLMYQVSMITQQEMRPLPLYTGAALTYFVVIFVVASGAARAGRALAPQDPGLGDRMGNWERLVWNQREALLAGLGVTIEVCLIAFAARDRRRPRCCASSGMYVGRCGPSRSC